METSLRPERLQTVLTIAGSDSGGGAGIQMDLQVFRYFGLHGASVLTALTAQDSGTVHRVHHVPPRFVSAQIDAVCRDLQPVAVKLGMLGRSQVVETLAKRLHRRPLPNLVIDPVLAAKDGTLLLSGNGVDRLRKSLLPAARVITPNLPEAEILSGVSIRGAESLEEAASTLLAMGPEAVIIKGGHRVEEPVDVLWTRAGRWEFASARVPGTAVHGTGCLYSAALCARLALGDDLPTACAGVKRWMSAVIQHAVVVGRGNRAADLSRIPTWEQLAAGSQDCPA